MDQIFLGEVTNNEYLLKQVKQIPTQSIMKKTQIQALSDYLAKVVHHDEQHIITINDQLPIRLSNDEANQLINELEQIEKTLIE
ncbi:hypothetical protein [Litchfieldia salsa]|uniref:Uncharacterized protein n=1 Tax=Litchfieldia salsa TaxID=930152 RepID=A0A1H0SU38_9BACI|nr:hypothetical protein [Litchfieldia salsa]SDP45194.1 hypothetical protein SAMN05216565_103116 [Litchfieldia salsa]